MGNAFSSTEYPTTEPSTLVAGDRWAWKRSDLHSDYPNDSYTLSYELRLEAAGSTNITITASASGTDFLIEVGQATTSAYTVGIYHWDAYITRDSDSERIRIDYGSVTIKPDLANATTDPRSHAKICLDAIEAVLENRATLDQKSYEIAGRSLERSSISELLSLKKHYKSLYAQEKKRERMRNGKGSGAMIKTRFRR